MVSGMNPEQPSPTVVLHDLLNGYILTSALRTAAELGVADLLCDGPKELGVLAQALGAHPPSLYRLLRALASQGVFSEEEGQRFRLTPVSELLRSDTPQSLRHAVLMFCQDAFWQSCGRLTDAVRSGQPSFEQAVGAPLFEHFTRHPELAVLFDKGMVQYSRQEDGPIAACYDFSPFSRVVDVGGGLGGFLAEILLRTPSLQGVLVDLPHVLGGEGRARPLVDAGVAGRCQIVAQDFFQSVPKADAYVFKRIIHDWNDEQCVALLRNCRQAMVGRGRVLAMDAVVPEGNTPHPSKVMDLLMMSMTEGRERTLEEFRALFAAAGLRLTRTYPTPTPLSIIEGEPA